MPGDRRRAHSSVRPSSIALPFVPARRLWLIDPNDRRRLVRRNMLAKNGA
jgi:hypothetical protein